MKKIGIIVMTLVMLLTTSCGKQVYDKYSKEDFTLGTFMSITIISDKKVEDKVFEDIFNKMDEIEKKMTINADVNSEVEQINAAAGKDFVKVSEETFNVIKQAVMDTQSTEGTFDLTVGRLVKLWNIGFDNAEVPNSEEIQNAVSFVSAQDVTLNEEDKSVKLEREGMMIDLGGIAKGYAADVAKEMIVEKGYNSALVTLGSSIWCLGRKPENVLFSIGIRDPNGTATDYLGIVSVADNTVGTSGTYERFFEQDGITYHHIIDPSTGYPANNELLSVTIITPNAMKADALSTGVFIMGLEKGYEFIQQLDNVEAIFITNENEIYLTEGAKEMFQLKSNDYKIVEATF